MKKRAKKIILSSLLTGTSVLVLTGCSMFGGSDTIGSSDNTTEAVIESNDNNMMEEDNNTSTDTSVEAKPVEGLELEKEMTVENAKLLSIDAYKDGYYVIKSHKGSSLHQLLVVPEGKTAPEGLDDSIIVVQQPVTSSKIDSLSLLSMLGEINPALLDNISLVSTQRDNISISKVAENMDKGVTKYAESAKKQDPVLIKESGIQLYLCNPGLEKEAVYDEIKKTGITPFITYVHSEADPIGRLEWVKALGVIYGDMESADKFYESQKAAAEAADTAKAEGKTYAMICVNKEKDKAYVRRTGDVIAKIGELAGGKNMLSDVQKGSWEEMSLNDFLEKYKDTDYLIYMDGHGDKITSIGELSAVSDKINDFKAVKEGHVWRTAADYLQMPCIGDMIKELNIIFSDDTNGIDSVSNYVQMK